jgi:hypothetical protein
MAPVESTHFDTLQLHAGYVPLYPANSPPSPPSEADDHHNSQEPDSATNARAVPIYASTVSSAESCI